jgi:PEP-CTERM motif
MKIRFLLLLVLASTLCRADSITNTFSGTAVFGNDLSMFNLGGNGITLFSTAIGATADQLFSCGSSCTIPAEVIFAYSAPGFSAGTWQGIHADSLVGDLDFSSTANGLISFTGRIWGYHLLCGGDCRPGNLVFDISLEGTGTATPFRPQDLGNGQTGYYQIGYDFTGTATDPPIVPEPGTLMLFGSGLAALAGIIRRKHGLA